MNSTKVVFNGEKLDYACLLMHALAHPLRLNILKVIDDGDVVNVNTIYNTLSIEQSVTSQHLKILKDAGVLRSEKDGKFVNYSINYDVLAKAEYAVNKYRGRIR